jgi:hypothetical protein
MIEGIDRIVCAAGARPDLALTRELRVRHDPWLESTDALAPLIDPNEHSCGSVRPHGHRELAHPESGYYAVGAKSYGRAPNFLMATGYEQVRSVVAALAGDMKAADDVQLELPETGVCNTRLAYHEAETGGSSGCCGSDKSDDDAGPGQSGGNCDSQAACGTSRPSSACCASISAVTPTGARRTPSAFASVSQVAASSLAFFARLFSKRARVSSCSLQPRGEGMLAHWLHALSLSGARCCA